MLAELLKHPKALGISLAFHAALIGLIVVNLDFSDRPQQIKVGDVTQAIKAKVIDNSELEEKKKQEALEAERKKEAEEKIKQAKKREEEKKRLAEEEQKRKEAEERRLAEEEQKRKEAEERRLAEEEQKRKEAELKARLEAEENQRRLSSLREKYILAIRQKVERNWKRPAGSATMPECEVNVTQGPGGIILGVSFGACGGSETYRKSIENAVYRAEPLPKPEDPGLFDRDLEFIFEP